jgi:hypothetical protein
LPLFAGPEFEGLAIEVRFRVIGRTRRVLGISTYSNLSKIDVALVIVGELRAGNVLVKAIWKCHAGFDEDGYYRTTPMSGELEFVGALEQFRKNGAVTRHELVAFFAPAARPAPLTRATNWVWHWATNALFGRPRLIALLTRFVLIIGIVFASGWLGYQGFVSHEKYWLGFSIIAGLIGLRLLWAFLNIEFGLLFSYHTHRRGYAKVFENAQRFAIRTSDEATTFTDDPAVRKCTADLESAGFVLLGEVASTPVSDPSTGFRIFRAPDGFTYLVLICSRNNMWLSNIQLEAQTFFQGGGRVDSLSGEAYGYTRRPTGHDTLHCVFPAVDDPVQLYWKHTAAVEAFAAANGLIPVRHERLEDYVRRQDGISEEDYQYFHAHPYSWGDHIRWYLQWPRRKQHG